MINNKVVTNASNYEIWLSSAFVISSKSEFEDEETESPPL